MTLCEFKLLLVYLYLTLVALFWESFSLSVKKFDLMEKHAKKMCTLHKQQTSEFPQATYWY